MLYRVYFNRLSEAPQVWSVDEGDQTTEVNVQAVSIVGANATTRLNLSEDNQDRPKAWLEVEGSLYVQGGVAVIVGTP